MRIATKTTYDAIIKSLRKTSGDLFKAQEIVTTNKRINKLSDDPVGIVSVLDLRSSLSNITQMERNISTGKTWLTASESALSQVNDVLVKAKELTVQMANGTTNQSQRANAVELVDGYLEQIISLAGSQSEGRYLFGGTNTDTIPFAFTDATETVVGYYGNETPFSVKIGNNTNIAVGKDGQDIFGTNWDDNNIFKTLIDLKSALQNNDVGGIENAMGKLDTHMTTVNNHISDIASKIIRVDIRKNIISDLELAYTERKSEIEDADLAEAIIKLNSMQLAYEASLNSSSKVMDMSLVNFL